MATAIFSDLNQVKATVSPYVVNVASITQAVKNLLLTTPGERLFLPEFGSLLNDLLFELMSEETALKILHAIADAIDRWEPRVRVNYSLSEVTPLHDRNMYKVDLYLDLVSYSSHEDQTIHLVDYLVPKA